MTNPRGRGSVGRASPCQGEGREFESRRPLHSSRCRKTPGAALLAAERPLPTRGGGRSPDGPARGRPRLEQASCRPTRGIGALGGPGPDAVGGAQRPPLRLRRAVGRGVPRVDRADVDPTEGAAPGLVRPSRFAARTLRAGELHGHRCAPPSSRLPLRRCASVGLVARGPEVPCCGTPVRARRHPWVRRRPIRSGAMGTPDADDIGVARPVSAGRLAELLGDSLPLADTLSPASFELVASVRRLVEAVVLTDVDPRRARRPSPPGSTSSSGCSPPNRGPSRSSSCATTTAGSRACCRPRPAGSTPRPSRSSGSPPDRAPAGHPAGAGRGRRPVHLHLRPRRLAGRVHGGLLALALDEVTGVARAGRRCQWHDRAPRGVALRSGAHRPPGRHRRPLRAG